MNIDETATIERLIEAARPNATVGISELSRVFEDRTLLLGVMGDGSLFHVYLQGGKIHALTMDGSNNGKGSHISDTHLPASSIVPATGSVLPEWTDYGFLLLLIGKCVHFVMESHIESRAAVEAHAKPFAPFAAPIWSS